MLRLDSWPVCFWMGWVCFQRLCKPWRFSWSSTRYGQPVTKPLARTAAEVGSSSQDQEEQSQHRSLLTRCLFLLLSSASPQHLWNICTAASFPHTPTLHLDVTGRASLPVVTFRGFSLLLAFPATALPYSDAHRGRQVEYQWVRREKWDDTQVDTN